MIEVTVLNNDNFPKAILSKCFYFYSLRDVKKLVRKELKEAGYKGEFYFGAFTPKGYKSCYIKL